MEITAKRRYNDLVPFREYFLDIARKCAALSIPTLMPPQGWNGRAQTLNQPYQGLAARGVINLSNKLMTTILPAGMSSFKLGIPKKTLLDAGALEEPEDAVKGLAQAEQIVTDYIEAKGWRKPTTMTLQLLAATGNALEYVGQDGKIRVFRLDQYVVSKDPAGNLLEVVICQKVSPDALSESLKSMVPNANDKQSVEKTIELYTWVRRVGEGYEWEQWIDDKKIPNSEGKAKLSPFSPLVWSAVPGEDYGRGKVEEHIADIEALDDLTKSVLDGSRIAAFHVLGVNPNGTNVRLADELKDADNGDVLSFMPDDLFMAQFGNVPGLQIAQAEVQRLSTDLSKAFLMTQGVQRNAERVTATEMRMLAEELDGALGGVYSMLSEEMQRSRIERLIAIMQQNGDLPPWSDDQVDITVTTGLSALGREQEALKVLQAYQSVGALPPQVLDYIKHEDALKKVYNGFGLPGLIRSEQEVNQMRQQQMMEQMAQQASMSQPQ